MRAIHELKSKTESKGSQTGASRFNFVNQLRALIAMGLHVNPDGAAT